MSLIYNIKKSDYIKHETKRSALKKFAIILFIFLLYFIFVSIKYGVENGIIVSILTWTFFVFCTPIAAAGFLVDFPVRLTTHMRMIHSEMIVWGMATLINVYTFLFAVSAYDKTPLLRFFKHLITHPYPYWGIVLFSASGTFLSIYFGDELLDVMEHKQRKKYFKHRNKYKLIAMGFVVVVIVIFYKSLAKSFGMSL